jgi:hypothetical protein
MRLSNQTNPAAIAWATRRVNQPGLDRTLSWRNGSDAVRSFCPPCAGVMLALPQKQLWHRQTWHRQTWHRQKRKGAALGGPREISGVVPERRFGGRPR